MKSLLSSSLPTWIRSTAALLALSFGLHAIAPSALAGPISSVEMLAGSTRTADLAKIQQALEHKVVNQRLGELGFTSAEIQLRLAQASDAELHQLATESEKVMAGGVTGLLISLLVIILLVFLILRVSENGTLPAAHGLRADQMMA
ncbi:hypothetical protein Verru16b_01497 [Lacunisphaera limnophila]|uniref:PA2779 family protein n=1 Tax=Lacunisphaera limnophila TaxID=1838286 RepID=A0A1D8AU64_9BACT|nr:PA2779 family protein [Lacunisphaera limnophila]AOS44435.1 hypothetical protein Verru16b_01497 [Lacunisphaera limnophila]